MTGQNNVEKVWTKAMKLKLIAFARAKMDSDGQISEKAFAALIQHDTDFHSFNEHTLAEKAKTLINEDSQMTDATQYENNIEKKKVIKQVPVDMAPQLAQRIAVRVPSSTLATCVSVISMPSAPVATAIERIPAKKGRVMTFCVKFAKKVHRFFQSPFNRPNQE